GMATRGNTLVFGHYALMVLEPGWITNRQIEAGRVALTREMKRGGKMWPRLFPDKPVTKKPAETRMGQGKGNPEGWVAVVKPGTAAAPNPRQFGAMGGANAGMKASGGEGRGRGGGGGGGGGGARCARGSW